MEQGEKWEDPIRQMVVMVRSESPGLGSFSRIEREGLMDLVEEEMNLGWMVVVPWCRCGGGEMGLGWMVVVSWCGGGEMFRMHGGGAMGTVGER